MKKKLLGLLIAVIGSGLLFVVGCVLVMFLAPGVQIFGIRYVANGISKCEEKVPLEASINNVYVDTSTVPVEINFTSDYNMHVEFFQDFIGFTKSKQEKASLTVTYDSNRNVHISANEIEEFIYSHKPDEAFHFTLYLPAAYFNTGIRSLYVNAKESNITVKGNSILSNIDIKTGGDFTVEEGSVFSAANKFTLNTSKSIKINNTINATDYDLTSTGGGIEIEKDIIGDLTAKTSRGDLRFISCNNLKFSSSTGAIKATKGMNTVRGSVDITTASGSVDLGTINTDSLNSDATTKVTTTGGNITIRTLRNGEIKTERGKVTVNEAVSVTITGNTGDISVKKVEEQITVNGKNGKVFLGEGGTINNAKVKTTSGSITAYNTYGKVDLKSEGNSVTLENTSSTDITLYAGRDLAAKNLRGTVDAYSKANMKLHFAEVSGNVTIKTGTKADKVDVDATAISHEIVSYKIHSSKGTKAKVYAGDALVKEQSNMESANTNGLYKFTVETSYAAVVLKFAV